MAGLLLDWLNGQLQLSRRVESLEEDFCNGYLLGEILHKHNFQKDFSAFSQKETPDAKIQNFCRLEPTMRSLRVPFDSRIASSIMQGNLGIITKLLYELRVILNRMEHFASATSLRAKAGVKPLPNLPQQSSKPTYDKKQHSLFEGTIRHRVDYPKDVLEHKALKRFHQEGLRQTEAAIQQREDSRSYFIHEIERIRRERLMHRKTEEEFLRTWNEVNVIQWIKNHEVAEARRAMKKRVALKIEKEHQDRVLAALQMHQHEVEHDLGEFENVRKEKLENLIGDDELTGPAGRCIKKEEHNQKNLELFNIRKKLNSSLRKGRDSRRQRFLVEDEEDQALFGRRHLQDMLQEELLQISCCDLSCQSHMETIATHELLFTENRSERERRYQAKADLCEGHGVQVQQSFFTQAATDFKMDINSQLEKQGIGFNSRLSAAHLRVEEFCRSVVERTINLAIETAVTRNFMSLRDSGTSLLPPAIWQDVKYVYSSDLSVPLLRYDINKENGNPWGPSSYLQEAQTKGNIEDSSTENSVIKKLLEARDVELYLSGSSTVEGSKDQLDAIDRGKASPVVHMSDLSLKVEPSTENPLSASAPYYLGDILVEASLGATPLPSFPERPDVPRFTAVIVLFGRYGSGRRQIAEAISESFGLKVLSVASLLEKAVAEAAALPPSEGAGQPEPLCRKALNSLSRGDTVPDEVCAQLVAEAVKALRYSEKNLAGWVLEDFPDNDVQASLLEKAISGYDATYVHADKWSRTYRLAAVTPPPPVPTALIPSGIDIACNVQLTSEEVLKKHFGVRENFETKQVFHLTSNEPSQSYKDHDKLALPVGFNGPNGNMAYKLLAHEEGEKDVKSFLARFGTLLEASGTHQSEEQICDALSKAISELMQSKVSAEDLDLQQEVGVAAEDQEKGSESSPSTNEAGWHLRQEIAKAIITQWEKMETEVLSSLLNIFRSIRLERGLVASYLRDSRLLFLDFLKRADNKQSLTQTFLQTFNSIDDDIRFDEDTKNELHLQTEELSESLWSELESRSDESYALLKSLKGNGWLEARAAILELNLIMLLQLEMDRFQVAVNTILDYHDTRNHPSGEGPLFDLEQVKLEDAPTNSKHKSAKKENKAKDAKDESAPKGPKRLALPPTLLEEAILELKKRAEPHVSVNVPNDTKKGVDPKKRTGNQADLQKKRSVTGGKVSISSAVPLIPVQAPSEPGDLQVFKKARDMAMEVAGKWNQGNYPLTLSLSREGPAADEDVLNLEEMRCNGIWAQSRYLCSRIAMISSMGEGLKQGLLANLTDLYEELKGWIIKQTSEEERSIEEVITLIRRSTEQDEPLAHDLRIRCQDLIIDQSTRTAKISEHRKTPRVLDLENQLLNEDQLESFRLYCRKCSKVENAERIHESKRDDIMGLPSISYHDFVDAIARLTAEDTLLPQGWRELSYAQCSNLFFYGGANPLELPVNLASSLLFVGKQSPKISS